MERTDVVVVGGGIAGVSAAYFLCAAGRTVVLLEMERALAHHTTGRSAALLFDNYGHPTVRPLTRASRPFFERPPEGLADHRLLGPRGALTIARPHQMSVIEQVRSDGESAGVRVELLSPEEAVGMVDVLRPGRLAAAVWEPEAADMDVAAIHQAFVRGIRRQGGNLRTAQPVREIRRRHSDWLVVTPDLELVCDAVVDAAGAWCDDVAALARVEPIGLVPKRRTAFTVPGTERSPSWPLVVDAHHAFYFKPDGSQLLCSPADETPTDPCDARPDEVDIALAIDRINEATTLGIRTVRSAWAGLRSFVPDGGMVIGEDPAAPGFFWLAGQGGTGIQTAPGAGMLLADLVGGSGLRDELSEAGVDPGPLAVDRLRPRPTGR